MREFEVGEIVHMLDEEPSKEQVRAAGCYPSCWIEVMTPFVGREGVITKVNAGWEQYGNEYEVDFGGTNNAEEVALYGIDFREFYEDPTPVITPEALITLLG